ncbi:type 1 periplasmic binding fold superfamily protein [Psychroserpens ponticola]|uniref:Type 1 periplasmic binding fold superfamily protein n=1 Tax=Psychroserpens ponticola TaxID=2932268 RepID=A0ABY7S1M1_9FLAO|nr:type 1 periplasmic binding fold superfamily protein [Psychroserpens ponticola]WCO03293.1 type 1 periplasmic binding fold superfamily protein [Psychroserpens ponticola]
MKTTKYFLTAILCLTVLVSCSDDDGNIGEPNEEEVITDVTLTFVNDADATDIVELKSVDADGDDGPLVPNKTVTGDFSVGATYTATLDVYNSIEDEDITVEITDEEPDEHFFIYAINGLDMTFARSANDVVRADGNKLGYETTWTANAAGTGDITIQLFHESESVNDDNELGTQTGGSTDINISFTDVEIQ